jgi:hypothetical protein
MPSTALVPTVKDLSEKRKHREREKVNTVLVRTMMFISPSFFNPDI